MQAVWYELSSGDRAPMALAGRDGASREAR